MELPGDVAFDYVVRGLSMAAIAKEYGCSVYPIFKALHAAGVPTRRFGKLSPEYKRRLEERAIEVRRLARSGVPHVNLARQYGYSESGIDKLIQKANEMDPIWGLD